MKKLLVWSLLVCALAAQGQAPCEPAPVTVLADETSARTDLKKPLMYVSLFDSSRAAYVWQNQMGSVTNWLTAFADKLNVCLTQTCKFQMLHEKVGTDYWLTGRVTFSDVAPLQINPYTGRAIPAPQIFAEVSYRVVYVPTGEVKWANVVKLDAGAFAVSSGTEFESITTEVAATSVADELMGNLFPLEIIARTSSGDLVIGEGGKSLKEGEFLTVFKVGEQVKDPRTGAVLDSIEEPIGTIQIRRVTARVSYARLIEGDSGRISLGDHVRRVVYPNKEANEK